MRITNIKFSFRSRKKIDRKKIQKYKKIISYEKNYNFIIRCGKSVFTLLGNNSNFINCTGLKEFCDVQKNIFFFSKFSKINIKHFFNFKIDCLTVKIHLQPGLKNNFFKKKSSFFSVIETTRFPATILKFKNGSQKISISYFNERGIAIILGAKKISQIKPILNLLKSEFNFE